VSTGARTAWIFLTRVPAGDDPSPNMARAVPWFPVIGGVVGCMVGGVYVGAAELFATNAAAALAVGAGALVTGAFHHDGLADMADAFGGGWDREQRLEILKDSRHGTYGVMALVCVVITQVAALGSLGPAQGFAALVTAHALGRAGAVGLMRAVPNATETGLGADYTERVGRAAVTVGVMAGIAIGAIALGLWVGVAALAVFVAAALCGVLAVRKIGGLCGDVLGAAEQLGETAVLLTAAALVHHNVAFPWWR
jgi:adenosylcobinamide-GDP ribazoletransferase